MEPETEEDLLATAATSGPKADGEGGEDDEELVETRKRGLTERIHETIHMDLGMREKIECEILFRLLISYFEIVKKNISDMIPKAVSFLLIDKLKTKLTSHLINELDSEAKVKQMSAVSPEIVQKRVQLKKTLNLLGDSQQILQELSHTTF
jgi:dynamin 1-like protein